MTESKKLLHVVSAGRQNVSSTNSADVFDRHNRPCTRRNIILSSLENKYSKIVSFATPTTPVVKSSGGGNNRDEEDASPILTELYSIIHDTSMIQFLCTAYSRWKTMGPPWDKDNCHPSWSETSGTVPPLVPLHSAFRRRNGNNDDGSERPSTNVMGAIGYYATDMITPIVGGLVHELIEDAFVICTAVHSVFSTTTTTSNDASASVSYAVTTHPGHHANYDCFGGYCYLNNAALAARLLQRQIETGKSILNDDGVIDAANYWTDDHDDDDGDDHFSIKKSKLSTSSSSLLSQLHRPRVAILDVDYHCGNGTASIFYDRPDIFVCSIHCDPEIDYPWNSGFADQTGVGEGMGTTLHIPLPKGSAWHDDDDDDDDDDNSSSGSSSYKRALKQAMETISKFEPRALVISLGLDTYAGDAVAVNRGGFQLSGDDYFKMGVYIGKCMMDKNVPCVFVQEGGYKMDVVGDAAADVVGGYAIAVSGNAIADELE